MEWCKTMQTWFLGMWLCLSDLLSSQAGSCREGTGLVDMTQDPTCSLRMLRSCCRQSGSRAAASWVPCLADMSGFSRGACRAGQWTPGLIPDCWMC